MASVEQIVAAMNQTAIFNFMSDEKKRSAAALFEAVSFKLGETVISKGEHSEAFYMILSGKARWIGYTLTGEEISISLLKAGSHFGERGLLSDEPAEATIASAGQLQALRLTRAGYTILLEENPGLDTYFRDWAESEGLQLFLKNSTILGGLSFEAIRSLFDRFEIVEFEEGQVLVREGEKGSSFYIIRSGSVLVDIGEKRRTVNKLIAGDYFGELALLTGESRRATVRAKEQTTVYRLNQAAFDELIVQFPDIKQSMLSMIAQYSQEAILMPSDLDEDVVVREQPEPPKRKPAKVAGSYKRKFKALLQQSEMDCGPTCLTMICRYYGVKVTVNRMKQRMEVSLEGVSLGAIAEAADRIGFTSTARRTSIEHLDAVNYPAIFHWKGNHFVVIYKKQGDQYVIADPVMGQLDLISLDELKEDWNGIVLELSPTPALAELRDEETLLRRYIPFLRPIRGTLLGILLFSILIQLILLSIPILSQQVVDRVIGENKPSLLTLILGGMLFLAVFQLVFTFTRQFLVARTAIKLDAALVGAFNLKLFGLPLSYFVRRTVGDVITRMSENDKVRRLLTDDAVYFILSVVSLVLYGGLMIVYNMKLAFISLAFLPVFALLIMIVMPMMRKNSRRQFMAEGELQSKVVEAVQGIATVKALAIEKDVRSMINRKQAKKRALLMQGYLLGAGAESILAFLQMISRLVLLYWGAKYVLAGEMTVGELVAFLSMFYVMLSAVESMTRMVDSFSEARVSMERLNDVFDADLEQPNPEEKRLIPPIRGKIEFQNVSFRYSADGKNVLQNLSFTIEPGQTVALVGRSGSGKTTLAQLLLSLYVPTEGSIKIDGYDIRGVHVDSLRKQIGVVQQENVIFSMSVRDNIAIHHPDASFEDIEHAAALAGANEFVKALALGYDTKIGEGGMRLSGGQKQRIAIARAILGNPRFLILDEATSALDAESERFIQRNMELILSDRTAILIAHRLSTVRRADRIIVLDQGTIVESGKHEELIANKGLYYYLTSEQIS
jgi:subfamily B ATP-binding cassette protein HlyB/CyaB